MQCERSSRCWSWRCGDRSPGDELAIRSGGFRAYLFRVARNRLIAHLRRGFRLLQRALRTLVLDQQIALGL